MVGYVWMLCIPLAQLENRIYIDENALQPGQVRVTHDFSTLPGLTVQTRHSGQYAMELGRRTRSRFVPAPA